MQLRAEVALALMTMLSAMGTTEAAVPPELPCEHSVTTFLPCRGISGT